MHPVVEKLRGGLIVSCQALEGNPLRAPEYMAVMAAAAEKGGAVGIRANGPEDIPAIRARTSLPIIGIYKSERSLTEPYITPDFDHARAISGLGVDIIAVDATLRPRRTGIDPADLIRQIREELGLPVMADIATYEEGMAAAKAGADIVATTLSGYTDYTEFTEGPDFELIRRLSKDSGVPVIGEGRFLSPEHLLEGFRMGAHAVVIGKIITNPMFITRRYVDAIAKGGKDA